MLNILFFIESLSGGGAEKVLLNLVNAMNQTRFAITVHTLYPEEAADRLAPGIRYRYCYPAKNRTNELRMRLETALGLTYPLHVEFDSLLSGRLRNAASPGLARSDTGLSYGDGIIFPDRFLSKPGVHFYIFM